MSSEYEKQGIIQQKEEEENNLSSTRNAFKDLKNTVMELNSFKKGRGNI